MQLDWHIFKNEYWNESSYHPTN